MGSLLCRGFFDDAIVNNNGWTGTGGGPVAFLLLHDLHAGTMFASVYEPPLITGVICSWVNLWRFFRHLQQVGGQ